MGRSRCRNGWRRKRDSFEVRKGEFTGAYKQCQCGKVFYAQKAAIKKGRKKYCSQTCKYRFRTRPTGLKYECKVVNPTWFVHGSRPSPMRISPKGVRNSPATEFKKGIVPANFAGDDVGYQGLHSWVRRRLGKAEQCVTCNSRKNVQWANISWEYLRDVSDWKSLCQSCHSKYDRQGGWGKATEKFGVRK